MENNHNDLLEKYNKIMKGYDSQIYIRSDWPMENGVYKQYSAYEKSDNTVGGTAYSF